MSVLKIENKTFIVTSKEKTLACLITAAWTSNSWLYFVCNFLRTSSKESTERSNKISANISLIYVACRDTFTSLHYSDLKKTEAEQIPDNEGTNVDLFELRSGSEYSLGAARMNWLSFSKVRIHSRSLFTFIINWIYLDCGWNKTIVDWIFGTLKRFLNSNSLSGYYKELKLCSDFKMAASFCLFIQHRDSGRWTLSVCSVRLLVVVCFCFLFQLRTLCGSLLTEHKLSSLTLILRMLGGAGVLLMDSSLRVWLLKCSPLKLKVPKH